MKIGKPAPAIYIKATDSPGISPAETLVVEDHDYGIAAARAAGAHIMIVEEITEVTYDRFVRSLDQAEGSN